MAGPYDRAKATALRLIDKFGADCLWQQPAPVVEDTPGYPSQGPLPDPIPCRIAFFRGKDVGYGSEAFMALLAGTEVPTSGEVGLMAGDISFVPDDGDTIVRNPATENLRLTITAIDRLAPDGTPILYFVSVAS